MRDALHTHAELIACPSCGHRRSGVHDSRSSSRYGGDVSAIKRRRYCLDCRARFTTIELRNDQIGAVLDGRIRAALAAVERMTQRLLMELRRFRADDKRKEDVT